MSTIHPLIAVAGLLLGVLGGYLLGRRRIASLTTALAVAARNANHDLLTGAPNRLLLAARVQELNTSHRNAVLAILNLDRFADINRFGYRIGDQLLVLLTGWLRHQAGLDDGTICRLRADEFAILWPAEAHHANVLTQRLLAQLAAPVELTVGDRSVIFRITATAGVTVLAATGSGDPTGRLLTQANSALQHAKQRHRGSVMRWHPDLPVLPRPGRGDRPGNRSAGDR